MQLSSPISTPVAPATGAVSAPFQFLYFGKNDNSAVDVENKLLDLAQAHKVGFKDLNISPAFLESNPPQGEVTGNVIGQADAVKQALAAIEILGQEV